MDPPPTPVKTFKYNNNPSQQQQPIFNNTIRSFSQNNKNSTSTTFEGLPFSSYLNLKPKENNDHDAEISIFDAQKYFCDLNNNNDPKLIKTTQLHHHRKERRPSSHEILPRLSSVSSADGGRNFRTRSFHATPTASSEASWNSQTGLLVNPPGSVRVSLKKFGSAHIDNTKKIKRNSSVAKKWIFGRSKCCCAGRKSVRVKEVTTSDSDNQTVGVENKNNGIKPNNLCAKSDSHRAKALISTMEIHQNNKILPQDLSSPENDFPATYPPRQQRISASGRSFVDGAGGFSFPILKNPTVHQAVKPGPKGVISKSGTIISPVEEDPPRDSLEVFQPMENSTPVNAATRHRFNPGPGSPIACAATTDDDLGSDASSDLFEIESFSTQTTSYPMYRRRDSLDEPAGPMFNARKFGPPPANGIGINNSNSNNNIQYDRRSLDEPPKPSVAATECYAPSEVSIDWSVTTAEGFDRASVSNFSVSASEIGGAAFFRQRPQEEAGGDGGKRKGNGGGLLLMSCRQEKSVSVGPKPVKCLPASAGDRRFS